MGWVKYATVGAKAGDNIKDEAGNVLDNDEIRNVDISISQGTGGVLTLNRGGGGTDTTTINKTNLGLSYTDGATVGAIFGSNMYSAGTTLFTAAQLKNANQAWGDVSGSGIPANNATVGAIAGTNLYKENGSTSLGDDDIVTNAGTSANTAAVGSVSASNAQDRLGAITNAGVWDGGTIPATKGGTGATNLNAVQNSRVTTTATGALLYNNTTAVAPNLGNITGTTPIGSGGTGETSSTKWLNANVTTFERNVGDIFWSNLSGNMTPAASSFAITITWRKGDGIPIGTSVVTVALATSTTLAAATIAGSGAQDSSSMGGAANAGVLQSSTVTKNSVVCTVRAQVIDGSGWTFKQEGAPKNLTESKDKKWHLK